MVGRPSMDANVDSPSDGSPEVREAGLRPLDETAKRPWIRGYLGLISLTLAGGIAAAAVIGGLLFALYLQDVKITRLLKVEAEYTVFKAGVKKLGEEAEAKRLKELETQRRNHDKAVAALEARIARANARADQLCKSAGLSSGCRSLPTTPSTARPADDTGFNERLLEVLRHAQAVADQLAELQAWVASNTEPR